MDYTMIEAALGISLPNHYKDFMASKNECSENENSAVCTSMLEDAQKLIEYNNELRDRKSFGKFKWKKHYFAIGCSLPLNRDFFYENNSVFFINCADLDDKTVYMAEYDKNYRDLAKAKYMNDYSWLMRSAAMFDAVRKT